MASEVGENAPLLSARVFCSGLSFALFGLVGLLLSLTVFPLFYVLPIAAHTRKRWSREVLSSTFPVFIRFIEICGLIRLDTTGFEDLGPGGELIVGNHPSLLDVVYLISLVDNANCLVKPSLFFNPFTAGAVRAAGYIRNDSGTLLEDCAASLEAGDNLVIFPEGTRTNPRRPFKFLRGAANIAIEAGCDIRPVVIRSHPARLMKHQAWYQMSKSTLQVSVRAFPPLQGASGEGAGLPRSRVSRRITRRLERFYCEQ